MCNTIDYGMAAGLGSENIHADDPRPSKHSKLRRTFQRHLV
jgi:hypothetical protein